MPSDSPEPSDPSPPAAACLRSAGEVALFAIVLAAPWPFASVEPQPEFVLSAGIAILATLWAAHAAMVGRLTIRLDVATLALAGLVLGSAVQLVPLPVAIVGVISPQRAEWHRTLLPEQEELLPGESATVERSSFVPLTLDPSATWTFLCRLLDLLIVYLVVRNWLATRESFPRLAWAMTANGFALTLFALVQSWTSPPNEMFWSVRVPHGTGSFGPFVCRNHFPDYVGLCTGLTIALLIPRHRTPAEGPGPKLLTGRTLALAAALGAMAVGIFLSQSRGGSIAVLVSGAGIWAIARSMQQRGGWRAWILLAAAVGAFGVAAWLGASAVEDRLATLAHGESTTGRILIWSDSARLVPGVWGGGTGGGTFVWAEPTVRRDGRPAMYYYEHAYNEYLEAFIEGGLVRGLLTIVLAIGTLIALIRGYRRRYDRSVGPWLLGAGFGLAVVAFHAVIDFGLHLPSVALLAAIVAGFGSAAAYDVGFIPPRVRIRKTRTGAATVTEVLGPAEPIAPAEEPRGTFRGLPATLLGFVVGVLALIATWDARSRAESHQLLLKADEAAAEGRPADRIRYLDARAAARPSDPNAVFDAAQAHLDEAVAATWQPGAGLAGGAAGFVAPPAKFAPSAVEQHLVPALKMLREARRANPLAPKPHARLGLLAEYFSNDEAASVHFVRAKRLIPSDPDVWYASGRRALKDGDAAAAWEDWKRSLELSPQNLAAILAGARGKLSVDQIRTNLLPDDPATVLQAAELLFPDRVVQVAERRSFIDRVVELTRSSDRTGQNPDRLMAMAIALDELGRVEEADDAWDRAVRLAPDRPDVHDRCARWLEREERYDEAVPHLEWLRLHDRGNQDVQDRLDAARHAVRLKREIEG